MASESLDLKLWTAVGKRLGPLQKHVPSGPHLFFRCRQTSNVFWITFCHEYLTELEAKQLVRLQSDCHVQVFVYVGTWTHRHSSFPSLLVLTYCYILRMYLHIFTWVSQFDDMSNMGNWYLWTTNSVTKHFSVSFILISIFYVFWCSHCFFPQWSSSQIAVFYYCFNWHRACVKQPEDNWNWFPSFLL